MNKYSFIFILVCLLLAQLANSQTNTDTSVVIYGWELDENLITPQRANLDTDLVRFQQDNAVIKKYSSVSSLNDLGSAYLPNNFFDRDLNNDLLFLPSYNCYFDTYNNTTYKNTRKPYSNLYYINSGQKSQKLEIFNVSFTQNATKKLNIGFDLKILSNKGQYRYTSIKNKCFKLYSSYSGNRYNFHTSFDINRYYSGENGGICDTLDSEIKPIDYTTNFSGITSTAPPYTAYVSNKIRYIDGMISQRVKLFTIGNKNSDSTNFDSLNAKKTIAEPFISHVIIMRRTSKVFEENEDNTTISPIFHNYYSNPLLTYDSIADFYLLNRLQLDFETKIKNKIIAGIFANINYDFQKLSYYSLLDSSLLNKTENQLNSIDSSNRYTLYLKDSVPFVDINKNINISNVYVSGGIYGKFWGNFQTNFSAKLYLLGYKAGETQLNGNIITQIKILKNPYLFKIQGTFENLVPSYQLNNYYSNNYIWEQDLNSIKRIRLSSKIAAPSNKFELLGDYSLLRNYIYITDSIPLSYGQNINIFAIGIEKEFVFWKFHSYNKFLYQVSENRSILDVPEVIFYNSTYFDNTWLFKLTNGKLRTMLGVDVHYNSSFNGYQYNPATSMFYQVGTQKIGNYPFIDIWFNMNLKKVLFFVKMEHFNSDWNRIDYYNSISYPANPKTLKFGLSWTFSN